MTCVTVSSRMGQRVHKEPIPIVGIEAEILSFLVCFSDHGLVLKPM